ncbi:MAG: sialidase [Planctomycetales bacterium 12-60-4]|nr:MAG: sialidase [Planctomycetales bacterium 12-60-4]
MTFPGNLAGRLGFSLIAVMTAGLGQALLAADPAIVLQADIYTEAPFPSCHASTMAETPQGLVAAWFGGSYEKHPDVGIWVSRRTKDTWSAPVEVANGIQYTDPAGTVHRHPCWNPVLFQMPDGPLQGTPAVPPSAWWGMLTTSNDNGLTWSQPCRLPEGILGPVKNKPILLAGGRLLCPTSSEDDGWRVHFEWTSDLGRTWTRVPAIHDGKQVAAIQPSLLTQSDGTLQAVGRTRNGHVFWTHSHDDGTSWSEPILLTLPNPNAGTDAVTLRDGRHILVYNHTAKGRSPLNVAMSQNGRDWEAATVLESEPGEFSYPAVIQTSDGLVQISYTWKRKRIRHVVLDPSKLTLRPIVEGKWPE